MTTQSTTLRKELQALHDEWKRGDGQPSIKDAVVNAGRLLLEAIERGEYNDSPRRIANIKNAMSGDLPDRNPFLSNYAHGYVIAVYWRMKDRGVDIGPFLSEDHPEGNPAYLEAIPALIDVMVSKARKTLPKITDAQRRVLLAVVELRNADPLGRFPDNAKIASLLEKSPGTISEHVKNLKAAGCIGWQDGKLLVTEPGERAAEATG